MSGWLKDIESARLQHNQAYTEAMLTEYADFFRRRVFTAESGAGPQSLMASILVSAGWCRKRKNVGAGGPCRLVAGAW